ncbi:MAG: cysteine hydrolase [Chloroflexi bacterium]|nr:cysteine hydrolase [Chloroflexota bacterium]
MKPAIIIVDMVKDNIDLGSPYAMGEEGRKIIPNLQRLAAFAREKGFPLIFASDSYLETDFVFHSRVKPHAITGTRGAEVIDELKPQDSDIILPKRRFSAFFRTDLDFTLRRLEVDTIAVAGVTTEVCVCATVLDGITNGFRAIFLSDCCASYTPEQRDRVLGLYQKSPLRPLLRVMTLAEFTAGCEQKAESQAQ